MNEVDVFSIQNERELYPVGWIHVHIYIISSPFLNVLIYFCSWALLYNDLYMRAFFYRLILLRVVSCRQLICIPITRIRLLQFSQ